MTPTTAFLVYSIMCILIQTGYSKSCVRPPSCCPKTIYRSYDGSCNNLKHPEWGMSNTTYGRLLRSKYGDGISTFALAKTGRPLPLPRTVSVKLFPDVPIEDKKFTINEMQYGQIITHDMSLTFLEQPGLCCTGMISGKHLKTTHLPRPCLPIEVPKDDKEFKGEVTCINFVRTITDRDRNCFNGNESAQQLSQVTHYLDLSVVYGSSDLISNRIREFKGGRLKVDNINGQEWPYRLINITDLCTPVNLGGMCDYASDRRANQNIQLAVLQVLLLRNHNIIAQQLVKWNPHWDDERVFQESRKINIAGHQYVSYYEWLPTTIAKEDLLRHRIIYETDGFVDDYDENLKPNVLNEHATGAFRFFHTQIAGRLDLVNEHRRNYGSLRISDWYHDTKIMYEGDNFDGLTRGLNSQMEMGNDRYHAKEITVLLFRNKTTYGQDLKAIDIQRNRDHGLASYNDAREFCHLRRAKRFEDLVEISYGDILRLKSVYEHVDDIDLVVGGALEKLVPGSLAGPTFMCIHLIQFYITRKADRFWFESPSETAFTLRQLKEIRKALISKLLCNNGKNIKYMQRNGFLKVSKDNPLVPCEDIPPLDYSVWKEAR